MYVGDDFDDKIFEMIEKDDLSGMYKKYRKDYSKYLFAKLKRINLKRKNCSN